MALVVALTQKGSFVCVVSTHAHAGADHFSLGASLFGCIAADRHFRSPSDVPLAWLAQLIRQNPGVGKGLMGVCRTTRALAIGLADTAEVTITAALDQPARQWGRLLHAVPRDLGARDRLTQVHVAVPGGACVLMHADTHRLFSAPSRAATHVTVSCPIRYYPDAMSDVLRAPGLANLQSLHTDICPTIMPHPAVLPQLKEVTFNLPKPKQLTSEHLADKVKSLRRLLRSTAPFLPQLTDFKCAATQECQLCQLPFPLSDLFSSNTPSTTLTELNLPVPLDYHLLTLLNRHAPRVKRLSVSGVKVGAIRDYTWGVEQLTVTDRHHVAK